MEQKQRLCKNKKCQKPLPEGYKHKYCEACRTQQAHNAKNAGKAVLSVVGVVGATAITIITAGKVNPKN